MKTRLRKIRRSVPGKRYTEYLTVTSKNQAMIDELLAWTRDEVHPKRHENYARYLWVFADLIECDFDVLNEHVDGKLSAEAKLLMQRASRVINDSDYSPESIRCLVAAVKVAFKHWYGDDAYHPLVLKFLKRPKAKAGAVRRAIYSEADVHRMLQHVGDPMWQFFLAYLGYDSGARPCELRRLTWRQLEQDTYGYYFHIRTAKDSGDTVYRPVRVLKSAPYFLRWKRQTHRKNTDVAVARGPDDYVFVNQYGKKLTDAAVTRFFDRLRHRLGVQDLTALSLRRSWITRKQCDPRLTTAQIQAIVGHTVGGNAIKTYTFLQDHDTLNAQLTAAGHTPTTTQAPEVHPHTCPTCQHPNPSGEEFCQECDAVLIDPSFVTITQRKDDEFQRAQQLLYEQCQRLANAIDEGDLDTLRAFTTTHARTTTTHQRSPAPLPGRRKA